MRRIIQIFIILAFTVGLIGPASLSQPGVQSRVQDHLLQMAAAQPEQMVQVIVQKTAAASDLEGRVARLGGVVTKDLPLIHAFAAEISAEGARQLGSQPGVRWVSLDAPMVAAQTDTAASFITWASEPAASTPEANRKAANFNGFPILAGSTIWFNSFIKLNGFAGGSSMVNFTDVSVEFTAGDETYVLPVPDAHVTIADSVASASTTFDNETGGWVTHVPGGYQDVPVFLTGLAFQAPVDLPGKIKNVTWSGRFTGDTPSVTGEWRWGAAVYSAFSSDYNALGVKPIRNNKNNPYANFDMAGTPENFKAFVVPGARGAGGTDYTGAFTTISPLVPAFQQYGEISSGIGPDNIFGYGSNVVGGFGGMAAEFTPGNQIQQVEIVLQAYAPAGVSGGIPVSLSDGKLNRGYTLDGAQLNGCTDPSSACLAAVDITGAWAWKWSDLDEDLEILVDQSALDPSQQVYYDAVGLRVTSVPGVPDEDVKFPKTPSSKPIDDTRLVNVYNAAVRATDLWNEAPAYLQGQGVTVAVIDSGIAKIKDIGNRAFKHVNFNREYHLSNDRYGHGTFVASIVAANGKNSKGEYIGIAPKAFLLNVRVSDDNGMGHESDIVEALQWLSVNKDAYNVRVVNLSLNSSVPQDYHDSPLCAAVEMLWFHGVVVVVSAGNNGTAEVYPPANDPYVITVGAAQDQGTVDIGDDSVASFSAYGVTLQGVVKPDLVAPGMDILAYLPSNRKLTMGQDHPEKRVDEDTFRMSGTSMSAPVVAGAVALLLQDEPNLTPDQVKYRLMATARTDWAGYDPARAGAGYLDIYAAVHGDSLDAANQGAMPHMLLARMAMIAFWASQDGAETVDWGAVNWNAVNWNAVNWNAVNWNAVNWNAVNWNAVNWNAVNWNAVNWNAVNWNAVNWNAVNWNAVNWNAVNWNAVNWNASIPGEGY